MTDDDKKVRWKVQKGKVTEPAKTFNPTEDNSDDSSTEAVKSQSIPIGRPISSSDYARLKESSRSGSPTPHKDAQEDPREGSKSDRGTKNDKSGQENS